jgi:putative heme iron utilization protein
LEAKRLLRLARTGALATLDGPGGAPLTTLTGVASDWDGAPLFLLSELSRHTRNLDADPRASLLLTSEPGRGDPLNHPRLTIGGAVVLHPEPAAKKRYLQRNPKAKLYASFTDFSVRRLRIESIHFNGGFGRAGAVTLAELLSPPGDFRALADAEDALLVEAEALGDETLARLAGASSGRRVWRPIGLDAEGLDLAAGGAAARVDFSEAAFAPEAWRERLRACVAAAARD